MRTIGTAVLFGLIGCSQASPSSGGAVFNATPFEEVKSQSGSLSATVYSEGAGPIRGANAIKLHVEDSSGPVDGLAVSATPWMPSHAHGTSSVPIVEALGNGDYVVRDINLFMPGRWQLRVSVTGAMTDSLTPVLDVP